MRVAVSALGITLDDRVDDHFGRARYLIIADTDGGEPVVVDNAANMNALQGAGIGAAEIASEHEASAVITGHLGPKAFAALHAAGIPGFNGSGMTVHEAVKAYAEDRLEPLSEAGEAHAG